MRTIQSEIRRHGLHQKKKVTTNYRKPNKRKEQFSKWEIEELMGMNRPKYYRSKGSYRSR